MIEFNTISPEHFGNKRSYNYYVKLKKIADGINKLILNNYLVYDCDNDVINTPFEFEDHKGKPSIDQTLSGGSKICWVSCYTDDDRMLPIIDKEDFEYVKKHFNRFTYIHPSNICKVKDFIDK